MNKTLLSNLGLISEATASSAIAKKALKSKDSLLTSNIIGATKLQKQIASSKTIGLVVKTKTGFTTIAGPAMKKVLKLHSKNHNSKIVGTLTPTKKGMNTSVSRKFATSKYFTSSKYAKLSSSKGIATLTSGSWKNKKIVKNPLAMTKTSKNSAYASTAGIKLNSSKSKYFKI